MPFLGAHMSIAGGYYKAVEAAVGLGMDTLQLFTKNNNQWAAKDITPDEAKLFKKTLRQAKLRYPTAHTSYLINIASPDKTLYRRSVESLIVEVERAELLSLRYLVLHPGAATDGDEQAGITRIVQALDEVHIRCPNARVQILLETTAGQGRSIGHRFEHLATILQLVSDAKRLGICVDTCHLFAAGYPLAPEKEYRATIRLLQKQVGLRRIRCFHLNDSKKPLGSRVDRHEHIGRGCLGLEPFRLLLNDPRFQKKPMILETPKEDGDQTEMDAVNLGVLRGLIANNLS